MPKPVKDFLKKEPFIHLFKQKNVNLFFTIIKGTTINGYSNK